MSMIILTRLPVNSSPSYLPQTWPNTLVISPPTIKTTHTLDLVITPSLSNLSPEISFSFDTPSDHYPIITLLIIFPTPRPAPASHSFRRISSINIEAFKRDLSSSDLVLNPPSVAVLGFCVWGVNGADNFVWGLMGIKRRRRETAIAEGKKPLTTRESGGAHDAPPEGSGAPPQIPTQLLTFQAKMEYIFGSC